MEMDTSRLTPDEDFHYKLMRQERALWILQQSRLDDIEHYAKVADHKAMVDQCREAEPGEYAAWLRGYVGAGGKPTHFYEYDAPKFWVATSDLEVRPSYGVLTLNIIVPEDVADDGGYTGFTSLFVIREGKYFTRGYLNKPTVVPMFRDTETYLG